jgi:hypothetical protein
MVGDKTKKGMFSRIIGNRTNLALGFLAVVIILGTFSALVYNAANTRSTDILTINKNDYDWNTLEKDFDTMEYDGNSGISIDVLLEDAGVVEKEKKSFRFIGADGYEKEIPWSDMGNGMINIEEKKAIFPDLAKAFWVRDLVEIEVV